MSRGVGVLIGLAVGWVATVIFNFGSGRFVRLRLQRYDGNLLESLPWLLMVIAAAAVVALLAVFARQLPGVLFGAGLFMTVLGLFLVLAPVRTAFDISRLIINVLDDRSYGAISLDGTLIFVGPALLAAGIGAIRTDKAGPQQQPPNAYYAGPQQQPPNAYYAAPPTPPPGQFPG